MGNRMVSDAWAHVPSTVRCAGMSARRLLKIRGRAETQGVFS